MIKKNIVDYPGYINLKLRKGSTFCVIFLFIINI